MAGTKVDHVVQLMLAAQVPEMDKKSLADLPKEYSIHAYDFFLILLHFQRAFLICQRFELGKVNFLLKVGKFLENITKSTKCVRKH
jgi:hypothetical protein